MRSLHRMDQHIFHGYQGRFSEGLNTPAHDGFLLSLSLIMLPLSEFASCFPLMFSNTSVDYGNKKCRSNSSCLEMSNWFPVLWNVKLISCFALHGKKMNARWAKIVLFSMREREFSFYFIKLSWKRFFSGKYLRIPIPPISRWKHSVFSVQTCLKLKAFWLVDNFSECIITLLSFLLFFLFRVNWVGCLIHRNTGTLIKQRLLYRDVP